MSFLDDEFLATWADAGHEPLGNVTGAVVMKTAGGPDGKVAVSLTFESGVLTSASVASKEDAREADLTLEAPWQLAADVVCGNADPARYYMAGDLKVSGDMALWLELLPAWRAAGSLGSPG
ncbi:SCP2 sterol-binding domain-containing protein [Candidatus Poriferisodalis sp.]|uniref:SCP2 sterol-binding domain-containing protein n=1 Tax=Candidatus Poriferisodalis sp. TaxID=3101277 RepID=UPI003B027323